GMILDVGTVDRDLRLRADACVVGSGAGGAVIARELAAGGKSVVVLEEGAYWTSRDFTQLEEEMYPRLYRERGTKPTADHTVLVSQGRALGGSTVVSFCLCFRTPRLILERWRERHGLPISYESLFPHFEEVESVIGARPAGPGDLNANNRILLEGSERLGYRGRFVDHNRSDCLGCGYCALGCAYDRKGDMLTTYLPAASTLGARILPEVRVEKVLHDGKRAHGVVGHVRRSSTGRRYGVRVDAPVVVLSAGALQSPMLWARSALPDPHRLAGRNLHLHPYTLVVGVFEDPVLCWQGIPQTWVMDEFLNLEKQIEGGYLAFAASAQPVATASLMPGLGPEHRRLMDRYAHLAAVAFFLNDRSTGRVRPDRRGRAVIDYHLNDDDKRDVMHALHTGAAILFAAGAKSVILPYNDLVELRRREDAEVIEERGILANDPLFLSFHPQGTLRMGRELRDSIVNADGRAHAIQGLFVADSSTFPTSVAVPPQISVMAFARRTAHHILKAV
ncbi:MAG: FAD-dependent oxidoreductase, partial [Candidatus Binatia bacterium]